MARRERNMFNIEDKELFEIEDRIRHKKAYAAMWDNDMNVTLTATEKAVCNMHTTTDYTRKDHIVAIIDYLLNRHSVEVIQMTYGDIWLIARTYNGCRTYQLRINDSSATLEMNYNGRTSMEFRNIPREQGIDVSNAPYMTDPIESDCEMLLYEHCDAFEVDTTAVDQLKSVIAELISTYKELPEKKLPPRKKRV